MREFNSFGAFGQHLARLSLEGEAVTHEMAEKGAKMIQRDAQNKLGHYQDHAGPFNAWDELADSTKEDRVNKGFPENEPLLRTGQLRDSIEEVVRGSEAMVGSMDPIALWQECGTDDGHIPPRPFLGPAAFESKPKLSVVCANTLIAWISGQSWRHPRKRISGPPSEE
ncbi:MAG: hypothetical protein JWO52_4039 [Gammaproteobacteria bacterium]|nr:hypothetical protein [Gammaproteobacteria bacterium]